jgi:hypothetical protein
MAWTAANTLPLSLVLPERAAKRASVRYCFASSDVRQGWVAEGRADVAVCGEARTGAGVERHRRSWSERTTRSER